MAPTCGWKARRSRAGGLGAATWQEKEALVVGSPVCYSLKEDIHRCRGLHRQLYFSLTAENAEFAELKFLPDLRVSLIA
jgi:hypothetical protein